MMEYVFVDDLHRYKRLKVTRACESCRRRKVKCDGGSGGSQIPCTSCRKLKTECIFSNMAMRRAAPKTELEQMNEKLQRSENLLQRLDEEEISREKRDILGHMKIDRNGRANYIHALEGRLLKEEPPLLSCHQIPDLSGGDTDFSDLVSHLIDLYFNNVHPYLPILHKENFLRRLHDKSNPISPLLLYAVFAMGSRFSNDVRVRLDPTKPETAGFPYFNRASELIDDFLDAPRLSTIQAQLLMMKFQEYAKKPGFFFRTWLNFGVVIRMAEDLGLNKNFDKWNLHLPPEDVIARKRVWQSCFLLDQFMCGAQGRVTVISPSNADIELPRKEFYNGDEQEFQLQTDFVHLVRLTKIFANIMTHITTAGPESQSWNSSPKLQVLDNAIDAWMDALPQRLRCRQYQQEVGEGRVQNIPMQNPMSHFAGFLNLLYHTIIILLHRPFINKMEKNHNNNNSNNNNNNGGGNNNSNSRKHANSSNSSSSPSPNHLIICTNAANNSSELASVMLERWGPQVFQYTLRGGNYGVYCLVASSMIHLVNMSSSDLMISKIAHDNLLKTLNVLKVCVDHSAAWELRDKVQGLEVAFSAQQVRQSLGLVYNGDINNLRKQSPPPPLPPSTTTTTATVITPITACPVPSSSPTHSRSSSISPDMLNKHLSTTSLPTTLFNNDNNNNNNLAYLNNNNNSSSSSNNNSISLSHTRHHQTPSLPSSSPSSSSLPSPPQFNEHPIYILSPSPPLSSPQIESNHHHHNHHHHQKLFTRQHSSHNHDPITSSLNHHHFEFDNVLLNSQINQLVPNTVVAPNTTPISIPTDSIAVTTDTTNANTTETYNTILFCNDNNDSSSRCSNNNNNCNDGNFNGDNNNCNSNNSNCNNNNNNNNNNNCNNNNNNTTTTPSSSSLDQTSTTPAGYWDANHFIIWNQLSNGQLSPPEYGSSPCATVDSPPTAMVEPVIVASQNNEDLMPISFSI